MFGSNAASLAFLSKPRILLEYATKNLVDYAKFNEKGLKSVNITELVPYEPVVPLYFSNSLEHTWFLKDSNYCSDILGICLITKLLMPETIFEIGTYTGSTTLHLAANSREDSKIFTLDLGDEDIENLGTGYTDLDRQIIKTSREFVSGKKYVYSDTVYASRITNLYGDSTKFDFSSYYDKIDLFFIDGAHAYEIVKTDTLNGLKCVRNGGVIIWHDYGRYGINGVTRWLHEFSKVQSVYRFPGSCLAYCLVKK